MESDATLFRRDDRWQRFSGLFFLFQFPERLLASFAQERRLFPAGLGAWCSGCSAEAGASRSLFSRRFFFFFFLLRFLVSLGQPAAVLWRFVLLPQSRVVLLSSWPSVSGPSPGAPGDGLAPGIAQTEAGPVSSLGVSFVSARLWLVVFFFLPPPLSSALVSLVSLFLFFGLFGLQRRVSCGKCCVWICRASVAPPSSSALLPRRAWPCFPPFGGLFLGPCSPDAGFR
eukprot:s1203_g16.t1